MVIDDRPRPFSARIAAVWAPGANPANDAGDEHRRKVAPSRLHDVDATLALKATCAVVPLELAVGASSSTSVGARRDVEAAIAKRARASRRRAPVA
jgi:hypothetical protein